MIFANAQFIAIVVTHHRPLVVIFTRLETTVFERMGYVAGWLFRGITPIDAAIWIARIHWRLVSILRWVLVVRVVVRWVVWLVSVGILMV
jgi:hypothetical protein